MPTIHGVTYNIGSQHVSRPFENI